jgi:hypothetical protein
MEYCDLLFHGELAVPDAEVSLKALHRGSWFVRMPRAHSKELLRHRLIEGTVLGWRLTPRGVAYGLEIGLFKRAGTGISVRKNARPADYYRDRLPQTRWRGTDLLPRRPAALPLPPRVVPPLPPHPLFDRWLRSPTD